MEILRRRAFARAGLVGNPSDGYHGKTISFIVRDYFAEVVLYEWEEMELLLTEERSRFSSVYDLARDVELHGYYGGIRLIKAAIKRFVDYCTKQDITLHDRNFTIRYHSNIPRAVGLAGSSAIVVATLRSLMAFYEVEIPRDVQASWVLGVESGELGIAAGLQDRVIQIYEGVVYMDFAVERMVQKHGFECGVYEEIDPAKLPPVYVAFSTSAGEPTEVFHNNLRARYDAGESAIVNAMDQFAQLAASARDAVLAGDAAKLSQTIDANFDLRRSICQLPTEHIQMVETARHAGASAKFAGSGGAIVGVCEEENFAQLKEKLGGIGCDVIRPKVQEG